MTEARVEMLKSEATAGRTAGIAASLVATLLGAFLILGAGFAPISAVHNAAHDSRHAFAFTGNRASFSLGSPLLPLGGQDHRRGGSNFKLRHHLTAHWIAAARRSV